MNIPNEPVPGAGPEVPEAGIVSVNNRGSSGGNPLGKIFFVVGLCGLLLVAGTYGYNRYRTAQNAKTSAAKQTNKNESKPAQAGILRDFEKEEAAAAAAAPPPVPGAVTAANGTGGCSDGSPGIEALGPDSKPLLTAQGVAMRVCAASLTSAASAFVVDLVRLDEQCGNDGRRHQTGSGDEDGAIAEGMAHREDEESCGDVASGVEGLVAAELPVKAALADQPHGDGSERRRKKGSSTANQHLRAIQGEPAGLPREQDGAKPKDERP